MKLILVLSCEHYTHHVPSPFKSLIPARVLSTHRAVDIGADKLYRYLTQRFVCFHRHADVSRLLIEINRSLSHPALFSQYTQGLAKPEKNALIETYYLPYRTEVERYIQSAIKKAVVLHISIHSFTPILNGVKRPLDIGLLYDPKRPLERKFCLEWKRLLRSNSPFLVKLNSPYRGTSDGFTTALRRQFKENYMGIELEINQKWMKDSKKIHQINQLIYETLKMKIQNVEDDFNGN